MRKRVIEPMTWCALAAVALLCASGCYVRYDERSGASPGRATASTASSLGPSVEFDVEATQPEVKGTWTGTAAQKDTGADLRLWVLVTEKRGNRRSGVGANLPEAEFKFLAVNAPPAWTGSLVCKRDAGKLELRGKKHEAQYQGDFTFVPDPDYVRETASYLQPPPAGFELLQLLLHDIRRGELAQYARAGLPLSTADICSLKALDVTPDYLITVVKDSDFSLEDIKRLHAYGVPQTYPAECRKSGQRFSAQDLAALKSYGVASSEVVAWSRTGCRYDAPELARLHSYGVYPEFGQTVFETLGATAVEDLIRLQSYGVSVAYLKGVKATGVRFGPEELVRLKSYGVSPEEINAWHRSHREFGCEELIRLHSYNVTPAFAATLTGTNFGVGNLIRLKTMGVSAEEAAQWREAGYELMAQDLIRLHVAGVSPQFAATLNVSGRARLSVDTLIRVRQRGMSPEEIRQLRE